MPFRAKASALASSSRPGLRPSALVHNHATCRSNAPGCTTIARSAARSACRWTKVPFINDNACNGVVVEARTGVRVENSGQSSPSRSGSRAECTPVRYNVRRAAHRRDPQPLSDGCTCYTCTNHSRAYVHHLFRAKEMLGLTLATIHNVHFLVTLVDRIRQSIEDGDFHAFREDFLGSYYAP